MAPTMDVARKALDVFLHLDQHLNTSGETSEAGSSRCERVGMDEGPIGTTDDGGYSRGTSGQPARCWRGGFCRFLSLHRSPKRSDVRRPNGTDRTIQ